ncbi:type I restriction endonuclease subunit R [Cetobacterium sp.]|uniref:type I restriction endonuclease subunit R n=1 Tax=Cetobacterium sp. TaxID=2071632 RepID=UPI003F309B30
MGIQSEAELEEKLIEQLRNQGYENINIKNEEELNLNFKKQLELHNKKSLNDNPLSDKEFEKIMIHLSGGSIFDKARKLRDQFQLLRDNDDIVYIQFLNSEDWCCNTFQVTNQISMEEKYKNRYDVTILINGLPLIQIELKRRGIELKEAFNQINRYQKHSYSRLFNYVQLFVISNGVNTKYYANNKNQSFKQTFYWTDVENNRYSDLHKFTEIFLNRSHALKMIGKYIVLHKSDGILMALRPYQYYAVESILRRVENIPPKNGYIWHTTGSGKTLTSFKASQLLTQNKNIDKVIFVVDRKDLDYQTIREFKAFDKDSIDRTDDTRHLVNQISDDKTQLIITTIQKLNNAISKAHLQDRMKNARDKKIVFIFDECHRSQFGDTHHKIVEFFNNKQMFGFTGTPIFAENAIKTKTTKDLFHECLHKYSIKDAIGDDNVLGFSVEYYNTFKSKSLQDKEGNDLSMDDLNVEGIDTAEVFESPERLENIVDFILANHKRKTYSKEFTSIFAVSSIPTLIKYYDIFKRKNHDLNIATIFTYAANEEAKDTEENTGEEVSTIHTREKLDEIVKDYNKTFGDNHDLNKEGGFNAYYIDISKKVKERKIDILLVVNMFLTGFDSKTLNTLYVDKNLKYHNLIQAYSRTNRILNEKKSYGNVLCFRNLKKRTDEAIALFSNKEAIETVLMKDYHEYVADFNKYVEQLFKIASSVDEVDKLETEDEKAKFITAYRNLIRVMNRLNTFTEFDFDHLDIRDAEFEDYRSKYLDMYDEIKSKTVKEKVSILDDLDFEVELLKRDDINVSYIMLLLKELDPKSESFVSDKEFLLKLLDGSEELRSKRELIEKFLSENLPLILEDQSVEVEFDSYWLKEKENAIEKFQIEENLDPDKLKETINEYNFSKKLHRDMVKLTFMDKLGLKERRTKIEIVTSAIKDLVQRFTL